MPSTFCSGAASPLSRSARTRAKLPVIERLEEGLPVDEMVAESLAGVVREQIESPYKTAV